MQIAGAWCWFRGFLSARRLHETKNGSGSLLAGVLVVCTVLAVFQTMSRAAVVVLLGVVCTVLVQYRSQRKWLWGGLGIALVLGAIFINGPGLYARMSFFNSATTGDCSRFLEFECTGTRRCICV